MSEKEKGEALVERLCKIIGGKHLQGVVNADDGGPLCLLDAIALAQNNKTVREAQDLCADIALDIVHDAEVTRLYTSLAPASAWQPMETAPKDGTWFQAVIPGHGRDNVIAWTDGGWRFVTEQEPPDDWTDGTCWAVNDDGRASTEPTQWRPLA